MPSEELIKRVGLMVCNGSIVCLFVYLCELCIIPPISNILRVTIDFHLKSEIISVMLWCPGHDLLYQIPHKFYFPFNWLWNYSFEEIREYVGWGDVNVYYFIKSCISWNYYRIPWKGIIIESLFSTNSCRRSIK